jgi:hypothetical protein
MLARGLVDRARVGGRLVPEAVEIDSFAASDQTFHVWAAEIEMPQPRAADDSCASLIRQFEFAMNVWVNDPRFKDLGNERDPFVGTQDGTFDMTVPKRPVRKKIKGLPAFTTIRGGAYFFLPGIRALRLLAAGAPALVQKPRKVS